MFRHFCCVGVLGRGSYGESLDGFWVGILNWVEGVFGEDFFGFAVDDGVLRR